MKNLTRSGRILANPIRSDHVKLDSIQKYEEIKAQTHTNYQSENKFRSDQINLYV